MRLSCEPLLLALSSGKLSDIMGVTVRKEQKTENRTKKGRENNEKIRL